MVYRLEEIDALGRTMSYGPFTVTFGAASWQQETDRSDGKSQARKSRATFTATSASTANGRTYELERLKRAPAGLQAGAALAASQSKERARITVKGRGLFYVNSAQIANSLGISAIAGRGAHRRA